MATESQVHSAIDALTASTLSGYAVLYGGMEDPGLSLGTDPYIRQSVQFQSNDQAELTGRCFRRHRGYVIFYIHWRKDTGDASRNTIKTLIERAFVSTNVGGATMQNSRIIPVSPTDHWNILGVQVSFYFDEVT